MACHLTTCILSETESSLAFVRSFATAWIMSRQPHSFGFRGSLLSPRARIRAHETERACREDCSYCIVSIQRPRQRPQATAQSKVFREGTPRPRVGVTGGVGLGSRTPALHLSHMHAARAWAVNKNAQLEVDMHARRAGRWGAGQVAGVRSERTVGLGSNSRQQVGQSGVIRTLTSDDSVSARSGSAESSS